GDARPGQACEVWASTPPACPSSGKGRRTSLPTCPASCGASTASSRKERTAFAGVAAGRRFPGVGRGQWDRRSCSFDVAWCLLVVQPGRPPQALLRDERPGQVLLNSTLFSSSVQRQKCCVGCCVRTPDLTRFRLAFASDERIKPLENSRF